MRKKNAVLVLAGFEMCLTFNSQHASYIHRAQCGSERHWPDSETRGKCIARGLTPHHSNRGTDGEPESQPLGHTAPVLSSPFQSFPWSFKPWSKFKLVEGVPGSAHSLTACPDSQINCSNQLLHRQIYIDSISDLGPKHHSEKWSAVTSSQNLPPI